MTIQPQPQPTEYCSLLYRFPAKLPWEPDAAHRAAGSLSSIEAAGLNLPMDTRDLNLRTKSLNRWHSE